MGSREATDLTNGCREVVVGTLLGDGCLERNGVNVRLRIDHSLRQRALVDWKFDQLSELGPSRPRLVERFDPRTGKMQSNYRFCTKTTAALVEHFTLFYGERGLKRIPENIADLLISPLSVAVWYMDDGGRRADCRSGYLNTNAYSVEDVELLKESLSRNFGIGSTTHFAAGRPRIYIPKAWFQEFCELVGPYMIDEMRYKLL